jgi:hypothetical protein
MAGTLGILGTLDDVAVGRLAKNCPLDGYVDAKNREFDFDTWEG